MTHNLPPQSVYVVPEHRRQGHFKRLYEYVRAEAQRQGAAGLRLYADIGNTHAHAVVRRAGRGRQGQAHAAVRRAGRDRQGRGGASRAGRLQAGANLNPRCCPHCYLWLGMLNH